MVEGQRNLQNLEVGQINTKINTKENRLLLLAMPRILETLNLLTNADSSTDTPMGGCGGVKKKKRKRRKQESKLPTDATQ